ncbi:MAG: FxLYD domain-containing protein [Anaerolineales bacterium]|nr:FxLYD domain-containing protein [Anaerolineales bacterium]MCB8991445.1 LysM peptidoglycan-binding domain-containing protein [Ardenticatenaceae bacterium]MCB9003935.1 LysM peptidoglycan-binding domain-containing protein [Ardenticatenaceae bacterium]
MSLQFLEMRGRFWGLMALIFLLGCRQSGVNEVAVGTAVPAATPLIGVDFVTLAPPTVAVIETTPTPLPTATPQPSPTPVVYTIVEGDTLLAIAWQRGNTVDDIVALNPGIQPELLQIGQQLVLPPPATPLAQAAASTPVPMQLAVLVAQGYQTPVGSLWLLGEMRNEGDLPVENVQVEFGLRDAGGNLLGTAVAWTAAAIIPPGETAPFGVLLSEPPAGYASPTVAIVGGESVVDLGSRYLDVVVAEGTAVIPDGERVQVSGKVQNDGDVVATAVRVILTVYDSQGQVSGYTQQTLDGPLFPGDNTSFSFDVAPPGGEPVSVGLLVNALRIEE